MNELEFTFEQSPWEHYRMTKGMGDTVSAVTLLSLLEGADEQQAEDALNDLETGCMHLDISGLPKVGGTGEAAVRLRQEMQLAKKGLQPEALEEGVEAGGEADAHKGGDEHAREGGDADRLLRACSRARREDERQHAAEEAPRSHLYGAEAKIRSLDRRVGD